MLSLEYGGSFFNILRSCHTIFFISFVPFYIPSNKSAHPHQHFGSFVVIFVGSCLNEYEVIKTLNKLMASNYFLLCVV